jgi:hypothetical protein
VGWIHPSVGTPALGSRKRKSYASMVLLAAQAKDTSSLVSSGEGAQPQSYAVLSDIKLSVPHGLITAGCNSECCGHRCGPILTSHDTGVGGRPANHAGATLCLPLHAKLGADVLPNLARTLRSMILAFADTPALLQLHASCGSGSCD